MSRDIDRYNNFDLIRLLAALQVTVIHLWDDFSYGSSIFIEYLRYVPGVPIFFFVSGFLIPQSLSRSDNIFNFYWKRIIRIYPGLYFCFFLSLLLLLVLHQLPIESKSFWLWIVAQLTIIQFYNPLFLRDFGLGVLNGSLWTIPVEIQFYIILPFIIKIIYKLGSYFLFIILFFAMILNTIFINHNDGSEFFVKLIQVTALPWIFYFLLGLCASRYWNLIRSVFEGKLFIWVILYALTSILLTEIFPEVVKGNKMNGLSSTVLCASILAAAYTAPQLSERLLKGRDFSFGLYLYHALVINGLLEIVGLPVLTTSLGWMIIAVALSLIFAAISWHLIEQPALRLKKTIDSSHKKLDLLR